MNVCMNYEFSLLHHVGVVAKMLCVAAAAETEAHEGDDNTPSGLVGPYSIIIRVAEEHIPLLEFNTDLATLDTGSRPIGRHIF